MKIPTGEGRDFDFADADSFEPRAVGRELLGVVPLPGVRIPANFLEHRTPVVGMADEVAPALPFRRRLVNDDAFRLAVAREGVGDDADGNYAGDYREGVAAVASTVVVVAVAMAAVVAVVATVAVACEYGFGRETERHDRDEERKQGFLHVVLLKVVRPCFGRIPSAT